MAAHMLGVSIMFTAKDFVISIVTGLVILVLFFICDTVYNYVKKRGNWKESKWKPEMENGNSQSPCMCILQ